MTLLKDTNIALSYSPSPLEYVNITPYYKNKEQNRADVLQFEEYVTHTYALATAYEKLRDPKFKEKGSQLLSLWINTNKGASNDEGNLYFVYKAHFFIKAASILNVDISNWISSYYIPACNKAKPKWNNHGAWALYGLFIAQDYLNEDTSNVLNQAIKHLKRASWKIPFISNKGELWMENLRNNSGMEYTSFYLNPMLGLVLETHNEELKNLVHQKIFKFFEYCISPSSWPYKAWPSIFRKLQKILFPSDDKVLIPETTNWAGNLIHAAGIILKDETFLNWTKNSTISDKVNLFRYFER